MAYNENDEEIEPYGEDEGSELEQLIAEEEQALAEAEAKQKFEIEEKLLKNKLRQIFRDISVSSRTSLKITERVVVKQAKEHPNLKNEINRVNLALSSNKAKNVSKVMSASPVLMYVLIGVVILFLIIVVVAFVGSLLGSDGDDPKAVAGITGNDFYGARMVYVDDERARGNMIEDYVELVADGIEETKGINSVTVSSENYNVELIINITIPTDYDYSAFDEAEFYNEYLVLYNLVYDIAKEIYHVDSGAEFNGSSLVECVDGIKYFGFANMAEISHIIANEIVGNLTFTARDSESNIVNDSSILSLIENTIETETTYKLTTLFANDKYNLRAEKLFVKDYILAGDDEMLSGVKKENYVAMIFMPKKEVAFTQFSFVVSNTNFDDFTINISADGNIINFTTDGANISLTEGEEAYVYSSELRVVSVGAFQEIDMNNFNALAEGISLFDVVESVDNHAIYLTNATDQNSVEYLTLKKNGVVVNLSNTEAFNFVEWETSWQSAS